MIAVLIFAACMLWGILTLWVPSWWPWSLFQIGIFLLAGWRVAKARGFRLTGVVATLAAAAAWPLVQLAAQQTVQRGATWLAALNWWTFLIVFLLATDLCSEPDVRYRFLRVIACCAMALAALSVAQDYGSPDKIFWLFPERLQRRRARAPSSTATSTRHGSNCCCRWRSTWPRPSGGRLSM